MNGELTSMRLQQLYKITEKGKQISSVLKGVKLTSVELAENEVASSRRSFSLGAQRGKPSSEKTEEKRASPLFFAGLFSAMRAR